MVPIRNATIRLRDGRLLAYCEWGHARGTVVLAFDGSPKIACLAARRCPHGGSRERSELHLDDASTLEGRL